MIVSSHKTSVFTCWKKLSDFLQLSSSQREKIDHASAFPLHLPYRLAKKIEKKTLDDPVLKQFLPLKEEKKKKKNFCDDPLLEEKCSITNRLLVKFSKRALLLCSFSCAMHCRFCFRKNSPLKKQAPTDFSKELQYLKQNTNIEEVILSGGDPLSLPNCFLKDLLLRLQNLSHIKRLRIHSRFPLAYPKRIDHGFKEALSHFTGQIVFVLHCNHPKELDHQILVALQSLQKQGIVLLNQSVLLKGVNDDVDTLLELCTTLSNHGILPYYLHQMDPVKGAHHFYVTEKQGKKLMDKLSLLTSGYACFRYVKEIPHERRKNLL